MDLAALNLNTQAFPYRDFIKLTNTRTLLTMSSPGLCQIRGAGTPRTFQKNRPAMANGATLIYQGTDLAEFEVDILLFDRKTHPKEWLEFSQAMLSKPDYGKPAIVLLIDHPILVWSPLKIRQVVVTDVMQPEPQEKGSWLQTIKFQEYAKPNAIEAKAEVTPAVPVQPKTPKDDAEANLQAVKNRADAAAARCIRAGG